MTKFQAHWCDSKQNSQSHPGALKMLSKNKNELLQSLLLIAFRLQP